MKKLVIFTGAGISKESGIPTFRDGKDGLWNNVPVSLVCTPSALDNDPEFVHDFYNDIRQEILGKEPNSAHLACVELEKYYETTVITQNIDTLHEKAGSKRVIKIHGSIDEIWAKDDHNLTWHWEEDTTPDLEIEGHNVRPGIVFFYESLRHWDEAVKAVKEADLMIMVGTSLQVYPAAGLLNDLPYGNKIYYIDPNPGIIPDLCVADTEILKTTATEGMKELLKNEARFNRGQ